MPGNAHIFGVTVYDTDGTTASYGTYGSLSVTIRNESTNESQTKNTIEDSKVVFNLASFTSGWTGGDRISYLVLYQGYEASESVIVQDTGGTQVDLTLVALTVAPSLRYFTPQDFLDYFNLSVYDEDNANGIKPETIVKVGQMVEKRIDSLTYRKWDDNAGSYYDHTDELHTVKTNQKIFWLKNTPVQEITRFEVNIGLSSQAEDWKNIMYVQLDNCDATTDWGATTDGAITLNTTNGEVNEGTGCLNIAKSGATQDNVTFSKTLSSTYDFTRSDFRLAFYFEDVTELKASGSTAVEIRIGSDSSNYYAFSLERNNIGSGDWNTITIRHGSDDLNASTTGTPDATVCDYIAIKITYAASSTTVTAGDMRLDNVRFNNKEDLNINYKSGRIEITDGTEYLPELGIDQVRSTYKQGDSSVDEDIKLLAILMTGKSFAKRTLQRLNIDANEVEGLSSAIQNLAVDNEEIKSILQTKSFPPVSGIWGEKPTI